LSSKPIALGESEELAETEIGVGRDGTPSGHDLADALRGYADLFGKAVLRDARRREELLAQEFPRGDRPDLVRLSPPQW
jgi:hypothetical protein